MTRSPLTSGLNSCIIKSGEAEAVFSSLERSEYPTLLTPLSVLTGCSGWGGRGRLCLLQDKPREKGKLVLVFGPLPSILLGLMETAVENSLGRCLHPMLVCHESSPAPLLRSLVNNEGLAISSCKETWGMGMQKASPSRLTTGFSWICHSEIVLLMLPVWKTLQHWVVALVSIELRAVLSGNCLCWCCSLLWCEQEGLNVLENNSINSAFSKLFWTMKSMSQISPLLTWCSINALHQLELSAAVLALGNNLT